MGAVVFLVLTVVSPMEPVTATADDGPAATAPAASGDTRFGVQTHFGHADRQWDPDELVPLLEQAGVGTVRDSQPWQRIEVCPSDDPDHPDRPPCDTPLEYRFEDFEPYMQQLDDQGIEPLIVAGQGNRYYDAAGGQLVTPYTDNGQQAYARYAADVVSHYRDDQQIDIPSVGTYNEPNLCQFGDAGGGGGADALPDEHADLANLVTEAVTAEGPRVVGPELAAGAHNMGQGDPPPPVEGCQLQPWPDWLDTFEAEGGLDGVDVVSIHAYRHRGADNAPEGLVDQLSEVRDVVGDRPIWITEMGWPNCGRGAVDEATQARYLPRTYAVALANGVERVYWYAFKDERLPDGCTSEGRSRHFGLLGENNESTPAYEAYRLMTQQLTDRLYRDRDAAPAGVHSYRFGSETDPVRVMWTPDGTTTVRLHTNEPLQVTDARGDTRTHDPGDQGQVTLRLTDEVQYVHGPVTGVAAST